MADITHGITFANGSVADPETVATAIMDGTNSAASFKEINGWLTNANRETASDPGGSSWTITRQQIRRRSLSRGLVSGSNLNLDFFIGLFGNTQEGSGGSPPSGESDSDYQPVAGLCRSFPLPFAPSLVCFSWNFSAGNDTVPGDEQKAGLFRFFINGSAIAGQRRLTPVRMHSSMPNEEDVARSRVWCGHHYVSNLTKGWHSAGIYTTQACNMQRFRTRSFKVIYFR